MLKEATKISVVAADSEHLLSLYKSGHLNLNSPATVSQLKEASRIILDSVKDTKDVVERRSNVKRRFIGLLLTILRPADVDLELAFSAVDYCIKTGIQVGSPVHLYRRKVLKAALEKSGVLYHFLNQKRHLQAPCDLVSPFRWCVNLHLWQGANNLLYILTSLPRCTLAHIVSSSYTENLLPLALAMIEIGIFCSHENCANDSRPKEEKFDKLIARIKQEPLSLLQLSRRVVRDQMKDFDVVRDSYTLPIPKILQDYVSLRFLDATIANMYFPNYQPMEYDLTRAIHRRYGVKFELPDVSYEGERAKMWKLDDDYQQLEEEDYV